jgi:hypothetical protein
VSDRTGRVTGHPLGATLAGTLLFVIGLAIGAGTYENWWKERELRTQLVTAQGTVVAVLGQKDSGRPVVAFVTSSGDHLSFTDRRTGRFAIGNAVRVLYPTANPLAAIVDDTSTRRLRTLAGSAAALLLIFLGAYVAWYARRWQAAQVEEP